MRTHLIDHPKVVRMALACKVEVLQVIGGLWAVWATFDTHSFDGTGIALWHEWRGVPVDLMVLATAHDAIAAAHSAALFLKRSTEPQPPEDPKS